ncbi:MAG: hypothetical protein KIT09_26500 [Bryobacteraceae bacterium]|nr:hypothetical protein [Bryobacteraceae bacterium]
MEPILKADDNATAEYAEWAVEGHAIRIAYSTAAMESMRQSAWEGLQKVPRRGLEVGGILYGTRRDDFLKIQEWRSIPCEHAKGPGFELSSKDEEELKKLLETPRDEPSLSGVEPLGWFHSHTRDGVTLTRSDLDIFNRFFPAPWQIALVLRPHLYEPTRAGFFFREPNGSIRSDTSYGEFTVTSPKQRFPGIDSGGEGKTNSAREEKRRRLARLTNYRVATGEAPVGEEENGGAPQIAAGEGKSRRSRLAYGAAAVGAIIVLLLGLPLVRPAQDDSVGFSVKEADGRLLVQWNKTASPVLEAEGGTIWITDGDVTRQVRLTPDDLRTASLSYGRQTGDVQFRLTLDLGGEAHSELADFSGPPPVPLPETGQPDGEALRALEAEVASLRRDLERQSTRNRQLRRAIQDLETQLGPARSSQATR